MRAERALRKEACQLQRSLDGGSRSQERGISEADAARLEQPQAAGGPDKSDAEGTTIQDTTRQLQRSLGGMVALSTPGRS